MPPVVLFHPLILPSPQAHTSSLPSLTDAPQSVAGGGTAAAATSSHPRSLLAPPLLADIGSALLLLQPACASPFRPLNGSSAAEPHHEEGGKHAQQQPQGVLAIEPAQMSAALNLGAHRCPVPPLITITTTPDSGGADPSGAKKPTRLAESHGTMALTSVLDHMEPVHLDAPAEVAAQLSGLSGPPDHGVGATTCRSSIVAQTPAGGSLAMLLVGEGEGVCAELSEAVRRRGVAAGEVSLMRWCESLGVQLLSN